MLIIQSAYVRNEPIRIMSTRLPNMRAQLKWAPKTGQNLQSPQEIREFFREVQGDVSENAGSLSENGLE
jgi:hypothetical protein